jgi:hypothetical protein
MGRVNQPQGADPRTARRKERETVENSYRVLRMWQRKGKEAWSLGEETTEIRRGRGAAKCEVEAAVKGRDHLVIMKMDRPHPKRHGSMVAAKTPDGRSIRPGRRGNARRGSRQRLRKGPLAPSPILAPANAPALARYWTCNPRQPYLSCWSGSIRSHHPANLGDVDGMLEVDYHQTARDLDFQQLMHTVVWR